MSHYGSGSTPFTRFFILTMLSLALILPVACGGGGGGDDTATVPTVTSH